MSRTVAHFLLLLALAALSCTPSENWGQPVVPPADALKDVMHFLTYRQTDLRPADEFLAHLLPGKQGRIVKVVNDQQELAVALRKEIQKEKL
ncbi:MAG TPA: hypothetical protein VFT06_07000 [Flavisolibacter sp.]|nr:hypothetical protein [Flavisolibacter sp.]